MSDEFAIIDKGYGKSWVKMLHLKREGKKHTIRSQFYQQICNGSQKLDRLINVDIFMYFEKLSCFLVQLQC